MPPCVSSSAEGLSEQAVKPLVTFFVKPSERNQITIRYKTGDHAPWEECVQVIFFDQLVAFVLLLPFFLGLRIVGLSLAVSKVSIFLID
jgi:hypothetical protein